MMHQHNSSGGREPAAAASPPGQEPAAAASPPGASNPGSRAASPFGDLAPSGSVASSRIIPDPTAATSPAIVRQRSASPAALGLSPHQMQMQMQQQQQQVAAAEPIPWLVAAAKSLPTYKEADSGLGSVAESRRFPTPPSPVPPGVPPGVPPHAVRSLAVPEHVDAEIAGLIYDLVHLSHEELIVVKVGQTLNLHLRKIQMVHCCILTTLSYLSLQDGPLPGAGSGLGSKHIREAALRRLKLKPMEVQKHVGLLEVAKKQLSRLVSRSSCTLNRHLVLLSF